MSVQVPITFPNLRLAISCLQGPIKYFKFPVYKLFCVLILLKSYEIEVFQVYLDLTILFDTSLILCGIRLDFKLKKELFRFFRDPWNISSFSFKKLRFRGFFLLNSTADKHSRFISCEQLRFMVPVSFFVQNSNLRKIHSVLIGAHVHFKFLLKVYFFVCFVEVQ